VPRSGIEKPICSWEDIVYHVPVGAKQKMREPLRRFSRRKMQREAPEGYKNIIKGISGSVRRGEFLAIIGPSGSGKTTLLDILSHHIAEYKYHGHVSFGGIHSGNWVKSRVGYLSQSDVLPPTETAKEQVLFTASMRLELQSLVSEEYVDALLDALHLAHVADQVMGADSGQGFAGSVKTGLSGGERRRVSLACELSTRPQILLADEPTSGLDLVSAEVVVAMMRKLADGTLMTHLSNGEGGDTQGETEGEGGGEEPPQEGGDIPYPSHAVSGSVSVTDMQGSPTSQGERETQAERDRETGTLPSSAYLTAPSGGGDTIIEREAESTNGSGRVPVGDGDSVYLTALSADRVGGGEGEGETGGERESVELYMPTPTPVQSPSQSLTNTSGGEGETERETGERGTARERERERERKRQVKRDKILSLEPLSVIATLHQPGSAMWDCFDTVMLVAEGHVAFYGPTDQVLPTLSRLGWQIPPYTNPADFLIEVVSRGSSREAYFNQDPDSRLRSRASGPLTQMHLYLSLSLSIYLYVSTNPQIQRLRASDPDASGDNLVLSVTDMRDATQVAGALSVSPLLGVGERQIGRGRGARVTDPREEVSEPCPHDDAPVDPQWDALIASKIRKERERREASERERERQEEAEAVLELEESGVGSITVHSGASGSSRASRASGASGSREREREREGESPVEDGVREIDGEDDVNALFNGEGEAEREYTESESDQEFSDRSTKSAPVSSEDMLSWRPPMVRETRKPSGHEYHANWLKQYWLLVVRFTRFKIRDPAQLLGVLFQYTFVALFAGSLWFAVGTEFPDDINNRIGAIFFYLASLGFSPAMSEALNLYLHRQTYWQEHLAGSYRTSAWYLAYLTVALPIYTAMVIWLASIMYWMVGFNPLFYRFVVFIVIGWCTIFTVAALASMLTAVFESYRTAQIVTSLLMTVFIVFGGPFLSGDAVPAYY
ncbi:hypothetical protein KIPB_003817, partial [Kipferlia bialata]